MSFAPASAWSAQSKGAEAMETFTAPLARVLVSATKLMLKPLAIEKPRILDTACGPGIAVSLLSTAVPHAELFASDFAASYVEETAARMGDKATVFLGDGTAMPEEHHGKYDAVISNVGLFLMPGEAVPETARLLKPGGLLLSTVWDMTGDSDPWGARFLSELVVLAGKPPLSSSGMFDKFSAHQRLVEEAGFKDITLRKVSITCVVESAAWLVEQYTGMAMMKQFLDHLEGEERAAFQEKAVAHVLDKAGHQEPLVLLRGAYLLTARRG